jgi:hypothetical protein
LNLEWLATVVVDGQTRRYAVADVEIDGVTWRGGLAEPLGAEVGSLTESIEITDPGVDWPAVAPLLIGTRATLALREPSGLIRSIVAGRVVGVDYGGRTDPIGLSIDAGGPGVSRPLPDSAARIDSATWPRSGDVAAIGPGEGRVYPIPFGYPGWDGTAVTPVMPIPVAQISDTTATANYAIVSEDPSVSPSSITVYDAGRPEVQPTTSGVVSVADRLGRTVTAYRPTGDLALAFDFSPASPPPGLHELTTRPDFYAGFSPAGGAGVATNVYDAIVYALRRFCATDAISWRRLPEVRDLLGAFRVDTWVDAAGIDGWAFVRYLIQDLPVTLRTDEKGAYLHEIRRVASSKDLAGSLSVDDGEITEASTITLAGAEVRNEFAARYRFSRENDATAEVVIAGVDGISALVALPPSTSGTTRRVVSPRCTLSAAKYGPIPDSTPLEIGWTWDEGTVTRILEWQAEQYALPARETSYRVEGAGGRDLAESDVIRITDTRRGLAGVLAIVSGPPRVTRTATEIDVWIPA